MQQRYRPWVPGDGYWCTRVTVTVSGSDIHFLCGPAEAGALARRADNIAVLFPPAASGDRVSRQPSGGRKPEPNQAVTTPDFARPTATPSDLPNAFEL
jgi:hypothetical protein